MRFAQGRIHAIIGGVGVSSLALLGGCSGSGHGGGASTFASTQSRIISVDFAQTVPTKSMSGFLHAADANGPTDNFIAPLQPRLWRGQDNASVVSRAASVGAQYCIICSDQWGYGSGTPLPNTQTDKYRQNIQQIVQDMSARDGGTGTVFDIWNEPDSSFFWHGSVQQYFSTFKLAHDTIRAMRPNALIAGPSLSYYNHNAIQQFLDYCVSNNIKLDILTWHEFRVGDEIPNVSASLEEARRDFLDNPAYAALGLKQIQINEVGGSHQYYKTATTLALLDQLERGGSDAAARSCFSNSTLENNCFDDTLDGLLSPRNRGTLAVWWAYKYYADGVNGRVASTSTDSHTFALASRSTKPYGQAAGPAQVIVGNYGQSVSNLSLTLNHLSSAGAAGANQVTLTIRTLPHTGGLSMPTEPAATTVTVPVIGDSAQTTLNLDTDDADVVSITPA